MMDSAKRILIGWMSLLCLFACGCRTTPRAESVQTTRPRTHADAKDMHAAQSYFDQCTSAFFLDDWESAAASAQRLEAIAREWDRQSESLPGDDLFAVNAGKFGDAIARLVAACDAEDVNKTASALRDASRHLAALRKLKNEPSDETTQDERDGRPEVGQIQGNGQAEKTRGAQAGPAEGADRPEGGPEDRPDAGGRERP